jgi:hypothetical protein
MPHRADGDTAQLLAFPRRVSLKPTDASAGAARALYASATLLRTPGARRGRAALPRRACAGAALLG